MKRIALSIQSEKHPDTIFLGYALSNEVTDGALNFFSSMKFQPDEKLEIKIAQGAEPATYRVSMTHLHEQISSGKIMNTIPDEEHPYPARTFYRCYAKVLEKISAETTPETETAPAAPTSEAAPQEAAAPAATPSDETDTPQAA